MTNGAFDPGFPTTTISIWQRFAVNLHLVFNALNQRLQSGQQTVTDLIFLGRAGLEAQYGHCFLEGEPDANYYVAQEDLISASGSRVRDRLDDHRLLFGDEGISDRVDCDFAFPLNFCWCLHSCFSMVFITGGLSAIRPRLAVSENNKF